MSRAWLDGGHASVADLDACARLLRGGSRTFFAASLLLPRPVRETATALYAFCRLADDAVDQAEGNTAAARQQGLEGLRLRLAAAYAGQPHDHPADRAFADVVAHCAIPRALPDALLEGFEWDAVGRQYETLAELQGYATRVAGTVGGMMCLLMGPRSQGVVARAIDLGIAMQFTNIARDVGEDARAGRLYLPRAWLRAAGIEPETWLAAPRWSAPLGSVVAQLLAAAEVHYARAAAAITELPKACRPAMHAARLLYAEIGREVERNGLDSVSRRAVVPVARKASCLSAALLAASVGAGRSDAETSPAYAAFAHLLTAVDTQPAPAAAGVANGAASVEQRLVAMIELFEKLERRDRAALSAASAPAASPAATAG